MTEIIESFTDPEIQNLVKSIEEVYFVCLFSILCFGQKLIGLYQEGNQSCLAYDHPSGSTSLKCSAEFKFETLSVTSFNTLAIYGEFGHNTYLAYNELCDLSFKHLILKDVKILGFKWEKYGDKCHEMSQSLTLINVKLSPGSKSFNFYHIYIERSDLMYKNAIMAHNLPKELRSLSLVSCLIQYFPPGIFAHTKSLQMLTISRNSLKVFTPELFSYNSIESLWFIDLSFNQINFISEDMLTCFPNLAEINLQSNHIQILPEQPFFRKWIEIDIVNLEANALLCDKMRWSTNFKPHPFFFDSATCYTDNFSIIAIGSLYLNK